MRHRQSLMDTMRAMRDRGELSPEEFDQARRALARKSVEEVEARLAAKAQAKTKVKGTMSAEAERLINAADESRNPKRPTPPDQHPKGR